MVAILTIFSKINTYTQLISEVPISAHKIQVFCPTLLSIYEALIIVCTSVSPDFSFCITTWDATAKTTRVSKNSCPPRCAGARTPVVSH